MDPIVSDVNIALERTLKLKFKTTGFSSLSILTKKNLFCPAIGGLAPGPPCLCQCFETYTLYAPL